jgi:hypothetical protein
MQLKQFLIVAVGLVLTSFGLLFVMPGMVGTERLPHGPERPTGVLGQDTPVGVGNPTSDRNGRTSSDSTTVGPDVEEVTTMGNLGVSVGHVLGLWPGRSMPLPVTYTNPQSFAVAVVSTKIEVTSATSAAVESPDARCAPDDLEVDPGAVLLIPPVAVGPHASTSSSVPVRLSPDAPDGCKGSSFTVSVTATAEQR